MPTRKTSPLAATTAGELERRIAELQAEIARLQAPGLPPAADAPPPKTLRPRIVVKTSGGAVVKGSVKVRDGDFIGRDYIAVLNKVVHTGEDAKSAKLALAGYLRALATDLAGLRLGEIDASTDQTRQTPLELPDIYVPLDTTFTLPAKLSLHDAIAAPDPGESLLGAGRSKGRELKMRTASALEALATHAQLTLLGPAGGGKSTFGAHVLLALAQAWLGHRQQLTRLGKAWPHGALLPIRVVLRRFAERHGGEQKLNAGHLWAFIGQDLQDGGWGAADQAMTCVQRLAREHGALVLFDGLDECGDDARRGRVLGAVRLFMKGEADKSRFLLTARPYAFPKGPDPRNGIYMLAELNDEQIQQFIGGWYDALVKRGWRTQPVADAKRDDLLAAVPRDDLRPLAGNPLLLTLMATLHSNRGRLPEDRVELYNETVQLLLERWNKDVGADRALLDALDMPNLTLSHLRSALEKLAFEVHEANTGESGTADIGEHRLGLAFRPLLGGSKDKADQVVEFIERRAGLLLGQGERDGERRFTFPHRTFQEFLAACHLCTRDDFARECRRLVDADAGHWRVVLPLAARLAKAERGATAADELVGGTEADKARTIGALGAKHWERALLAGMQLHEIGTGQLALSERSGAVLHRVQGWLLAGLPLHPGQGGAAAVSRAKAGDVLAALGDPRFDPERFFLPADEALGFERIPADPAFFIGTRPADKARIEKALGAEVSGDELNDKPVPTSEFWIARYPVTVAQFRAYVQTTGLKLGDADALRQPDTRPVCSVSWHEALDYCRWLTEQLRHAPALAELPAAKRVRDEGWQVSLPSELEWEVAARGSLPGQAFSWGDQPDPERANGAGSGINTTSAVGCFAPNAFGLYDMLGNEWEWTRSLWTAGGSDGTTFGYPYTPGDASREDLQADDDIARCVRGGSWGFTHRLARCAFRFRFYPDDRFDVLGFRVVLRSPPVL